VSFNHKKFSSNVSFGLYEG